MFRKAFLVRLSITLAVALILTGCSPASATPAATSAVPPTTVPVEAPTSQPTVEGGDEVAVVVDGTAFTLNDLLAMEQVAIETTYKDETRSYTGVRILDLLGATGAEGEGIVLVADDGYEADAPMTALTVESLLAYRSNGGLQAVLPGVGSAAWVKGVVEIRTSAESKTDEVQPEGVVVVVNGVGFTDGELKALPQVTVETTKPGKEEKKEYTGVRVLDLLEAAGIGGDTVVLVADDGYEAEVPLASLTDECILYYRTRGGLSAAMPGLDGSAWVKGVVEVRCTGEAGSGTSIEVVDALGRTVTFDALPRRIVVPGKGSWMVGHPLYLFPEAEERVLAMEARKGTVSNFIAALEPGFMDKPHLETNAAPEQIAPLKPDAVVTKSYMKKSIGDGLELLGFPVVYVELETPEQFFSDVVTIGQLLGNDTRAQEIIDFYESKLRRVEERLEGLKPDDRPSVLVIQYDGKGEELAFEVPPAAWMQTIQVELAGGRPVWTTVSGGGGWEVVNFEQIAAWDPDKIMVIVFRDDPEPVMTALKGDSKWQALRAVQSGDVYAYPSEYYGWDVPDPRWILGVTWSATKIHPGLFADVDIMDEVYEFYGEMYGMDKDAVDQHIVPELRGDVD